MKISYIKLWKLLLDKTVADISTTTLAKLGKDLPVSMEVIGRICEALDCDVGDVMEFIRENDDKEG
jgi:putative transcriptional regulator